MLFSGTFFILYDFIAYFEKGNPSFLTRENFLRILEEIFINQWPVSHLELEAIKFQVNNYLIKPDSQVNNDLIKPDSQVNNDLIKSDSQVNNDLITSDSQVNNDLIKSDSQVNNYLIKPDSQFNNYLIEPDSQVNNDLFKSNLNCKFTHWAPNNLDGYRKA